MVLIVGTVTSAYFAYSIAQNTTYNEAVRQNNLDQLSYQAESINVTSMPKYNVLKNNTVGVNVDLQNDGSVQVQIRTLWVHGVNSTHYNYVELGSSLAPGQSMTITRNLTINGVVVSQTANETFYGWVVTSRGKTISLYPAHETGPKGEKGDTGSTGSTGPQGPAGPPSVTALVSQGIGSISMDFKSYLSYTVTGSGSSGTLTLPDPAFKFSLSSRIAFSLNVTNLDPSHMSLNLTSDCQMWLYSPASGAIKGEVWKMASVNNEVVTTLTSSQFIILPYNQTTTLYFGPYKPGGSNLGVGITAVNLVLTGKIGNLDYGQNLPFISLMATS